MNLSVVAVILTTLLLSVESLWLFALSAHIARFMDKIAPAFWIASLLALWVAYFRSRSLPPSRSAMRLFAVGVALVVAGALLGAIAIALA